MADNNFCVDIGEKFTKVSDATKIGDTLQVDALGKIDTDASFYISDLEKSAEKQAAEFKKLVDSLKITKKNVNVVVPGSLTYSQILVMPQLNEKELVSAIKYQADQFIPMPIEETNIDLEVIEELKTEKKLLILIVAAPKKLIEKIQTTIEYAGLIPESIENELSASSRLISQFNKKFFLPDQGGVIVANLGLNSTTLAYFDPITFNIKESHNFAVGYHLFLKEIAVNADADEKKSIEILQGFDNKNNSAYPVEKITGPLIREFTAEVKRFVAGKKISVIYIFNQIFLFTALSNFVTQAVGVSTQVLDPYKFIIKTPITDSAKNELSLYAASFGGNLR
ncbi:MAG: Type IV pilus biogenesis protein PilM [Candidatus Roizmanbacteria bacterium GW2011_GWA2_35_8]|uniref:Type IV pilus biogenesis protein PilM n=1 Tax=Candidatus Roizmanbacteria bacterium GW2011_GWA2_35_8 TaxID=1618479 RepID=A0A0G0FH51_9BACT|nr:MAG: Type IV pilus biogenesis protein PilM [Candidatus Roizmanbacteria bacterium GW2011_GWA2_35_8]